MRWPRDMAQGAFYALLLLKLWMRDHAVLLGWLFLIGCALCADVAAILLALASAHRGLHV